MIEGLKPYPEYRESGLPWLGRYPSHWVIKRGKSYMTCVDQRSKSGKEELLTVSSARGVIPRHTAKVTMFKAASYSGYKLCWPGDLVINSLWAWGGGLGVTQHHGIISTAYSVYRPRPSVHMNPRFLHELVRSSSFNWELHVRSKGIWISRLQLTDTSFLDAPIPLPPPDEQAAIVRFLDHANRKIDGFIRAKRKLIGLLNEQKQAIIHRAVTRGLNPNAPLKPSGIPWLGDIPMHWELRRLRQIAAVNPSKSESADAIRGNAIVTFLPMERVKANGAIDASELVPASNICTGFTYFRRGDVIVAKITPCFENGKGAFLDSLPTDFGFGSTEFHVLRPNRNLLGGFLRLVTSCRMFLVNGANNMTGSAGQQRVPTDFVRNYPLVLPPVNEQQAILDSVAEETGPLNTAIARTEREITLMQEYRTRLTADVVTGKLDVREAAAKLPDSSIHDAQPEESDMGLEPDEGDDENSDLERED